MQPSSDNPFYIPTPHRATYTQPESALQYSSDPLASIVEKYAQQARSRAYADALNDAAAIIISRREKLGEDQLPEQLALKNATKAILDSPNPYKTDAK